MLRSIAITSGCVFALGLAAPAGALVGAAGAAGAVRSAVVAGDLDGDGYGVDDCAPLDPSVHPGATDRPDLDFTDVDCDGIDGAAADAVFVSLAGNDAATGTRANPLGTIAAAVTKAAAEGKDVYVAGGTYGGTAALADDVGVYGGYEPGTWNRSTDEPTTLQGSPAALAVGDTGVVLQLLELKGQQDASGNSYGLRAVPDGPTASQVLLEDVAVVAASGANGAAGSSGGTGVPGAGLAGGAGGLGGCGSGALGQPGSPGVGAGAPGSVGASGANGTFDAVAAALWSRPSAGSGGQGGFGGGGAGGRGGVGGFYLVTLCGGMGGAGGAGGGGGFGGSGGQAGGGSFAVYTFNSSVVAVASALESASGGTGGPGGFGGSGGAPGSAAAGLLGSCFTFFGTVCAGTGLPGGAGAAGGSGGRGGGGAGGPSTPVYQGGSTSGFTDLGSTLVPGTGGAGGAGGLGTGAAGIAAPVLRTTGAPTESAYDFDGDGTADPADQCPAEAGAGGGCPTAPETTITRGPADDGYLLSDRTTFEFSSTGGTSSTCSLDGGDGFDCTSPYAVSGLGEGTHVFRVWSRQSPTNADPTPAARTFTVPRDSTVLEHAAGWAKKTGKGYFLGTFSTSTRKGSALSSAVSGISDLALVATRGVGFGKVKVMLGSTVLKKISLASDRTRKKQLIPVASFDTLQSGTVKIVVLTDGKTVRVEGLGIRTG